GITKSSSSKLGCVSSSFLSRSSVIVAPSADAFANMSSATITSRPNSRRVLTTNPVIRSVAGSMRTRWMLPASCPSFVLIFAFRSMRIASPPKAAIGRIPAAGRTPVRSPRSIRHVHVTASTHAGPLKQRRQPPLLPAQRVEEPERLVHGEVPAEVRERSLHGHGRRRTRGAHGSRRKRRGRGTRAVRRCRGGRAAGLLRRAGRRRALAGLGGGLRYVRREKPEDLVDHFDVEFRIAVVRVEPERLDVRRAGV